MVDAATAVTHPTGPSTCVGPACSPGAWGWAAGGTTGTDAAPFERGRYDSSPEHVHRSVEASLTRLGTDHLDVLLVHRPDPLTDSAALGGPCSTRWWTRGWCGRRSQQPRLGAAGGFAGTHRAAVGGRPGAAEPGPPAVGGGRRARQHRRSSRGRGGGAGGARGIGGAGAGPGVRWSAGGTPGGSVATPRWPRQQPRRRPPRSWPTWPPRTARRASPWCSSGCRRTRRASRRWWGPPRRGGWCLRGRRGRAGPPGP